MAEKFRLLVVDDEETLRQFLVELFMREGYEVTDCGSAREALQRLDQKGFDLLVSDIKMPEMDGLELLRRVRVAHPEMPVVMMTGHGTVENAIHALNLGAFNFIRKPFAIDEILKVVQKGLEVSRPYRMGRGLLPYLKVQSLIKIPSRLALVHAVSFQIVETAALVGRFRNRSKLGLRLAVEELLTNAIIHGNRRDEAREVTIQETLDQSKITVTIMDQGEGFDVHALPDPTNPDNLFKSHGRGIFLARFYMDEVVYNDKGNMVTISKSLTDD